MKHKHTALSGSDAVRAPEVTPDCLRRAIELDHLTVEYQPKYDLLRRRVTGVEALARWNCPTRGDIGPDSFIPIAEASGQIKSLGEAILFKSCREFADIREATGLTDINLAVNVSGHQLRGCGVEDFVFSVNEALRESTLPAESLYLELTETTWCRPTDEILGQMEALSKKGIHIVVDDFGAGAAGLNRLIQLPIFGVKIDKGFVQLLDRDSNSEQHQLDPKKLLAEIIRFVRSLGLSLVAEGVERLDQARWLAQNGCPIIQGFLVSKPKRKNDLIQFLRKSSEHTDPFTVQSSHLNWVGKNNPIYADAIPC